MNMATRWLATVFLLFAALLFATSAYTVGETEQVVLTRFGEPVGDPITAAGLHFKVPFVQKVNRFDKRILSWDGEKNQIPTRDKRYIWVDTTARWRIADPRRFLEAVRTEQGAQARLDDILDSATRNQVSAHDLLEVVRLTNRVLDVVPDIEEEMRASDEYLERIDTGRDAIQRKIQEAASRQLPELGIELVDLRIKRINYVDSVRRSVYDRMISERNRIAERYRSEGEGLKAEILGRKEREEKTIASEAYRQAQEIVARADAEAAAIYATSYDQDPELYAFLRTLETWRGTIGKNHTLVVDPASEFYRFLVEAGAGAPP